MIIGVGSLGPALQQVLDMCLSNLSSDAHHATQLSILEVSGAGVGTDGLRLHKVRYHTDFLRGFQ